MLARMQTNWATHTNAGGNVKWYGKNWAVFRKNKHTTTIQPSKSTLGTYSREMKNYIHTKTCK